MKVPSMRSATLSVPSMRRGSMRVPLRKRLVSWEVCSTSPRSRASASRFCFALGAAAVWRVDFCVAFGRGFPCPSDFAIRPLLLLVRLARAIGARLRLVRGDDRLRGLRGIIGEQHEVHVAW